MPIHTKIGQQCQDTVEQPIRGQNVSCADVILVCLDEVSVLVLKMVATCFASI